MSGGRWTDRGPSAAEDFPKVETRNLELPGTRGPDGAPLVVTLRRLPILVLLRANINTVDPELQAAEMGRMAEAGIVAPLFTPALWDALPFNAQLEITSALAEFTTEGLQEVRDEQVTFRGGSSNGASGGAGGGHLEAIGAGEAAAPAAT